MDQNFYDLARLVALFTLGSKSFWAIAIKLVCPTKWFTKIFQQVLNIWNKNEISGRWSSNKVSKWIWLYYIVLLSNQWTSLLTCYHKVTTSHKVWSTKITLRVDLWAMVFLVDNILRDSSSWRWLMGKKAGSGRFSPQFGKCILYLGCYNFNSSQ